MRRQKKTILLIGYDEHLCLSIGYTLRNSDHQLLLLTHKKRSVCRFSRYISKVYYYEGYEYIRESIVEIAKQHTIDLIMPYDELESLFVSKQRKVLEQIAPVVPITAPELFQVAINKNDLKDYLSEHNLNIMPRAVDISNEKSYPEVYDLKFPILMKPSRSSFGRGIETTEGREHLASYFKKHPNGREGFSAQEFITGSDITCNIYAKDGKIVEYTVQESPVKSLGNYAKNDDLIFDDNQEVYDMVSKVAGALNWDGIACVDLRKDHVSGQLYLLEINGRFWGSVSSSLDRANVNFPEIMINDALGLDAQPRKKKSGVQISNHRLIKELKRLKLGAIMDTKYKSYLFDPMARILKYVPR